MQIPITVKGVEEPIGNMDLILGYSSSILEPIEIVKGSLTSESLFDYNIVGESILISLADNAGITSDGSIAYILCNVVGNEGSSCSLVIEEIAANSANDYEPLSLLTRDGIFLVTDSQESIGDCNGDGKLTAVDALCALQMAVGKRTEDLSLDMNSDGKVSSLDARTILKIAVGGI